ncbi:MAG: glycoside hydrolase family 28 protein [Gammaproteobacteria bacterium]|nr:glycoside hydrolase family 28 protein [Gammaproteobacteria bacterium]
MIRNALTFAVGTALFPLVGHAGSPQASVDPWEYVKTLRRRFQAPQFADRDFPISDFGAHADDKSDCTKAINDAIRACSESGGGRVVVPAGDYRTGTIHLLSNVNLHIEEGATLSFYTDPALYLPHVFTRFEGTEFMGYSPLIYAYEQENIAITGAGTLDGRAKTENWWSWKEGKNGNPPVNPTKDRLTAMAAEGVPPEKRVFGDESRLRPSFVQPYKCRNVLIEGIRIRRAPFWQVHPVLCTNVVVRGLDVKSHGFNNDGCNPESCRYVLIENCRFDTGDDCIAIKSGRNADGRRVNVPSEDILVANCKMKEGHGGVVVGSEMSGGVRNVFVEDCRMSSPDLWYMLRIKTNSLRGGFVENVHVRNTKVGTIGKAAIRINFHYSDGDVGEFVPRVSNVSVADVTGENIRQVLSLRGYERSPVRNIHISDCRFKGVQQADVIEHVENLVLENVFSDFSG